ncbi:hypothetical protein GC163_11600 [bacterium]|nr:hypothetical protein [bacterium]
MPTAPHSFQLLKHVGRRLRLQSFVTTLHWSLIITCGVYLAALLMSRLTGLFPEWFSPMSLVTIPVVALVSAVVLHRRPGLRDAARVVDQSSGVRDLYLTLSLLETAAGEYQPLVVQAAESQAPKVQPARVVPLTWQRRHWQAVAFAGVVALAMVFLPQLDPFGKVAAASLSTERQDRLNDSRVATQLRIAEIKKGADELGEATEADQSIDQLKLTFNKMQPQEKRLNMESLMDRQRELADQWKKLATDPLQNLLKADRQAQQQFGQAEEELLQKWNKELQSGSTEGLQQELQSLKDQLQKLAKAQDPLEKQELQKKIQKKLETLEKFAQKNLDSKPLASALQRAMQQMDLSSLDNLSSEALEGAMESLELSEMELEDLAKTAQELKKLEEALKTLRMAKRLNDHEKLDGKECQKCKSLSDYEKLYREMLSKCEGGQCQGKGKCAGCGQCQGGNGNGAGMGGRGIGEGNIAPEDNSITTEFQTEQSKSAVTAGKVLLSMKSKGQGERGNVAVDYQQLVNQVKLGVSEAILQEQVPPGYHDQIKKYFDALEPADAPK